MECTRIDGLTQIAEEKAHCKLFASKISSIHSTRIAVSDEGMIPSMNQKTYGITDTILSACMRDLDRAWPSQHEPHTPHHPIISHPAPSLLPSSDPPSS